MKGLLFIIEVLSLVVLVDKLDCFNALFIGYYVLLFFTLKNGWKLLNK